MYDHYKPFRNFIRLLDRQTALIQIWGLLQNISYDLPLPPEFQNFENQSVKGIIHPWELEILAREVILHAGSSIQKNFFKVNDLLTAISHIRRLVSQQSKNYIAGDNVLHEMHRIAHQQFPWQKGHHTKLARYLKIFSSADLQPILVAATGLTIEEIYLIGTSISGSFLQRYVCETKMDYTTFGISDEKRDLFFSRIVMSVEAIKERTQECQEYNENWCYTINPLLSTPLLVIDSTQPTKVICPVPGYIFDRISDGLIFDIYKVKGYEQPFGFALQDYVRDITNRLIEDSILESQEGSEYYIKKNRKHGTDLYLFDDSTAMLIECKARRFNLKSKYQGNDTELVSDLKLMAKFVVQNYKNLTDVIDKYTPWDSSSRTLYPVVVTLMDCYIWTPIMLHKLDAFITEKMEDAKLDPALKINYPYSVMSVADYELSLQIIRQVGMQTFFNDKKQDAYLGWSIESFIRTQYGAALENCRTDYLKHEFDELVRKFSI